MPSEEARFRAIFRKLHAEHPNCLRDEWLSEPCKGANGRAVKRPIVWSRRNGPWRQLDIFWVGAAPGNAGGKGAGVLGAHATRIPFGGDVAGANLDVLLSSIGITRNDTFIVAALNMLPRAGGGEPAFAELAAPVGTYESSIHSLRDTVLAARPRLIVCLGIVGLRALFAAVRLDSSALRLPSLASLERAGMQRNIVRAWPAELPAAPDFVAEWHDTWPRDAPHVLWLTHPSAQNMSPYAGEHTLFHRRMLEARDALRSAAVAVLKWSLPGQRAHYPSNGVYALPEWRELVGPRHEQLDELWRSKGV